MEHNKAQDPWALDDVYRKAASLALDGGDGARYLAEEVRAQGLHMTEEAHRFYKNQLKRYRRCCWRVRALYAAVFCLFILQLAVLAAFALVLFAPAN